MRHGLASDLWTLLSAVRLHSESAYSLNGERFEVADSPVVRLEAGDSEDAEEELIAALGHDLYHRLYTRSGAAPSRWHDAVTRRDHVAMLARVNCGRGAPEPRWRVRSNPFDGKIRVQLGEICYLAPVAHVSSRDGELSPGKHCRVLTPNERRDLNPGFYTAVGDGERSGERAAFQIRLYWHLRPESAVELMRALTFELNRKSIPFRLKVLASPQHYHRADAGVLYLEPGHFEQARSGVLRAYRAVRSGLRSETPLLTARLAHGLGLAEGPGDGRSFGESRCRLVAETLARAQREGRRSPKQLGESLVAAFRQSGLDPCHPHLAPGSQNSYAPLADPAAAVPDPQRRTESLLLDESSSRGGRRKRHSLLEAAARIGDQLCDSAYWHEDRCNWIGRCEQERESGAFTPRAAALGPNLYDGTSGIALFLAELHAKTSEEAHRRTALGGLRQASLASGASDDESALALFVGRLGVAHAGRRIGALTSKDLPESSASSTDLSDARPNRKVDLISGKAGAILALLAWYRGGEAKFLRAAVRLGKEVCRAALRQGPCWSWVADWSSDESGPRLTGLAHGAAGIGLALMELYDATGEELFFDAAAGAFAYEDELFDRQHGNWPDLRETDEPSSTPRFAIAWCHGCPGITLARLRVSEIDSEHSSTHLKAARSGAATTMRALARRLKKPQADTTLCHGLSGLIEVVATTGREWQDDRYLATAEDAMQRLIARHGVGTWPSGVASRGPNPSLMLGTAGIGYTMLRLHDPAGVPSVLLPGT